MTLCEEIKWRTLWKHPMSYSSVVLTRCFFRTSLKSMEKPNEMPNGKRFFNLLTYDLDVQTWPRYPAIWPPCKISSLYVCPFSHKSETGRHSIHLHKSLPGKHTVERSCEFQFLPYHYDDFSFKMLFWPGDLDLWPMISTLKLDLDIIPLRSVCLFVCKSETDWRWQNYYTRHWCGL